LLLAGASCVRRAAEVPPLERLTAPPVKPYLAYVSVAGDSTFHRLSLAPLGDVRRAFVSPLACDRMYVGGDRGVCLTSTSDVDQGKPVMRWWASVFDDRFAPLQKFPLSGPPSRVRVSSDGRRAAATVFEEGHSYAENGFSTRTTIFDLSNGALVGDLERFETRRDDRPFREPDFNFWGVTFARDSDTFFATLDTGGISYLVKGTVSGRRMDIVHAGVECPSLSPDNTRVGFKKRLGTRSRGWWQLAVLALDTMTETLVSRETRSIDDQVEWLDNDRVVYHLTGESTPADLWTVRVDDSAAPERLLAAAYSPAVVR
jgi:hypothetical protein